VGFCNFLLFFSSI